MRTALWAAIVVLTTALTASAASPTAECRRDCGAAKRTCVAGAKSLFQSSKADCGASVSKSIRQACTKSAKGQFRSFKQACGTALQACKGCCGATGAAALGGTCAGGGGSPVDTSSICPGITGGLAAYWDWLNGVFHPLAQIPTAGGLWPPYQHPGYPLLGFRYPPDWTPSTIAAEPTLGVNLLRNDGAALWREVGTWGDVSVGPRAWRDGEINAVLEYLGNPGPVTTICVNEETAPVAAGVTAAGSNIVLTAGNFTIIIKATTTAVEGLGGGQILANTIFGPTAEFGQLSFDVFLPIHFQLFIGSSTQDSDFDGVPDGQDNFPNDPTRS
ncbi:MAG TPA: hypothetical protein VGR62_09610 [Candidatus Binatia bacterium]|jgi:hypothetical protein|nr:hypothetical protein [Candidatus Binatia bacterium]